MMGTALQAFAHPTVLSRIYFKGSAASAPRRAPRSGTVAGKHPPMPASALVHRAG